jgi:uncharacterized protein (TIGR00730 family)
MKIKRIAVYCGSSVGDEEIYITKALALIQDMHKRGYGLVYGGGNVGIMGIIADEMLRLGGEVIGVIPKRLMDKEVGHTGLTQQIVVDSMHERKAKMFELCDACIALPGGIGTMEELFEAFTWSQLGFHFKPCGVLNVNGFYKPLDDLLQHMVDHKFLKQDFKNMLLFNGHVETLLNDLEDFEFPKTLKWH